MEIPIKINSLNGLIVDFGDYDVNQTVEAVKEFYLSNFVINYEKKEIKGMNNVHSLFREWIMLTKIYLDYDLENSMDLDRVSSIFTTVVLLSAIQLKGLKEWKSPFF